jgi:HAD superfamily phosphatase
VRRRILVFDMDGVLAEVTESYREAIVQTVRHFTGQTIARDLIQDYKNQGGWNNDWKLSQKICADLGVAVDYGVVVDYFNGIFFGNDADGLILREQWIPRPGLLDRLASRFELAIFTGRLQSEAAPTLRRFVPDVRFAPIIGAEDVSNPKPAPDGLLRIRDQSPGAELFYVGDTVDDSRSAKAAGVPFIGIASPANSRHGEIVRLLQADGAIAVLDDVNQIEEVLPQ